MLALGHNFKTCGQKCSSSLPLCLLITFKLVAFTPLLGLACNHLVLRHLTTQHCSECLEALRHAEVAANLLVRQNLHFVLQLVLLLGVQLANKLQLLEFYLRGYVHKVPLPRVPIQQSPTELVSQVRQTIPDYYELSYTDPTYDSPCSIVKSAAYAFHCH